jgi:hypothetical protein
MDLQDTQELAKVIGALILMMAELHGKKFVDAVLQQTGIDIKHQVVLRMDVTEEL